MRWIDLVHLAADDPPPLLPPAVPTPIPGMGGVVQRLFGYGLWILVISGGVGVGVGGYKLAMINKGREGNASEPFKWMGGGIAAVAIAGALITIVNGVAK
ncbi:MULTISPECIES: hypothetical protein [Streptomyces]|uniref:hypothetical protein n=1 Tax=Streptomyces TaxID=1883 RepID=UPI0004ADBEFE|nr:hypothetical protein [Streptomyces sp. DpondAA-D4]SCD54409.1 hypothetical protein GA0115241_10374 [Streptomyces sp. DpondAA-D4]